MIVEEDDNRVVFKPILSQLVQQGAERVVEPEQIRPVVADRYPGFP